MREKLEIQIQSTLLSQSPREESPLIAVLSAMVVLFVSLLCWQDPQLFRLLAATPHQVVAEQEYWRLITAIAVHADLGHFLSNAIFFTFFVYLLYGYFGFWMYPVSVAALGALINYCSLLTYPGNIQLVGASGVVYLMAGFWLTIYVFIERTRPLKKRLLHAIGIGLIVLIPTSLSPRVSYRTHAIGCGIGIIAAIGYFQARKDKIRSLETLEMEALTEVRGEGNHWIN
ncbi:rhomboid family intramembrane serine protease [Acidobacteria bacterium AH-259-D05]|nr:rhomboid family intramembrane serine protease [Acidobacteria bacterium AH-259-D05]